MRFNIKNKNIFPMPGNKHLMHLATIEYGLREFVVMLGTIGDTKGKAYIEEVVLNTVDFKNDVFANLKFIEDDNLANDLAQWAMEKGLLDMRERGHEAFEQGIKLW
tara:strand:+ start:10094 stop:10411 length:318 start_codon:yes stop_codon:yes gene_type:complete